jgi:hypothetical protein
MLKEEPIRSKKYLRGAEGSPCTFMAPGICNHDPRTTVFAHLNGAAFGKGAMFKAHDIAGLDACSDCHAYIDVGHGTKPQMSDAEFWWHLLRGQVLTLVNRARRQIIIVPLDPERLPKDRPATAPKVPKPSRPIPSRPFAEGSRPIPSRPFPAKEKV